VIGLKAKNGENLYDIRAELVVGADGRHSIIREKAKLKVEDFGAPMDVLWFSLSAKGDKTHEAMFYTDNGKLFLMLNRGTYWQCGFIIKKGDFERIKAEGLDKFRQDIHDLAPPVATVVDEIKDWEQVKLLTVAVDHLTQWYKPGLICIGDSAHAMSPIGGVGINLAIQDAVAAANILVPAFRNGQPTLDHLKAIQKRRDSPSRLTQRLQVFMHKHLIKPMLNNPGHPKPPLGMIIFNKFPFLKRLPAKKIGIGFRPEHIEYKIS